MTTPRGSPFTRFLRPAGSRSGGRAGGAWRVLLLSLLTALAAAACGQSGPLFLPEARPAPAESTDATADGAAEESEENKDEKASGA